jgi:tRNA modification GTPase
MRPADAFLDTIAALATPAGRSALAVVRLSGPESTRILSTLAPELPPPIPPRRPRRVVLSENGAPIDEAVVTFLPAASSPTGEDVVEISLHGSPMAIGRLLSAAIAAGARAARPGEFTERAFRSGRIDLVRAEAVRELIEARTPAAARASARRLSGALTRRIEDVRGLLLAASAALAAVIDFSDDVGDGADAPVRMRLTEALSDLDRLAATARPGRLLAHGCRAAILGPPNAGKSTLFNAALGRDRAIVTAIAGTTRDTLEAELDLGGVPVTLVDTAGLRATGDVVETMGVERSREEARRADVVVYVFDASAGPGAGSGEILALSPDAVKVLVANKADRLPASPPPLPAGAALLCGIAPDAGDAVRNLIARAVTDGVATDGSSEMLGSLRQADLVGRARTAAADARTALERGDSPEYAATHCHAALDALADLVGETTSDDVLDRLFATFCIGK